ncbi:hypothetical protein ACOSP7_008818 [Xanthoceras sorbifolium]
MLYSLLYDSKVLYKTVDHALWGCSKVQPGWFSCPFVMDCGKLNCLDFIDRFSYVASTCDKNLVSQFLVAAWFAWHKRNQFIHGVKGFVDDNLWLRAGLFLKELVQDSVSSPGCNVSRSVPSDSCWKPPDGRNLKLNVDAAVNKAAGKIGIGVACGARSYWFFSVCCWAVCV